MASEQNNHPLPAPPGQQQNFGYQQTPYQSSQPSQRPGKSRASKGFSFHSQKSSSGGNNNTGNKLQLVESHGEKEAKRLHSKADPTMAMNEAEPSAVAAQGKSTMASLRSMQHKDSLGNIITDPDQANPTRWRMERPLDTIRSFQKSIERNDRSSMIMPAGDNESVASWNRNSYYANGNSGRYQHASYYGSSRPQSGAFRTESYDQQPQGRWGPPPQDRRRYTREFEPQYNQRQPSGNGYAGNPYSAQVDHRSYETVASGSPSSGERPGYSTDPTSSDNSSIERRQSPLKRQSEPTNDYGIGFNQAPEYQPSAFTVGSGGAAQNGYEAGGSAPPAATIPRKDVSTLRRKPTAEQPQSPNPEKRRSWFRRLGQAT